MPDSKGLAALVPVFLSYPKPYIASQEAFLEALIERLEAVGITPRTLGVTDYDTDAPLTAIRRLMLDANGLMTVAFRRSLIKEGASKPGTEGSQHLVDTWLTSPWAQIEPAMAFQLGLPLVLLREKGVRPEGILEPGITGLYMPEFDLDAGPQDYLESDEFKQILWRWAAQTRAVVEKKGQPPKLY